MLDVGEAVWPEDWVNFRFNRNFPASAEKVRNVKEPVSQFMVKRLLE